MEKIKKSVIGIFLLFGLIIFSTSQVNAEIQNVSVTVLTNLNQFSGIWLGISTGGYKILAERGHDYTFRVFIKNGMDNRSLHNIGISPKENFSFKVNGITPNLIEQLKPMEIRIYYVNITIPENTTEKKYPILFDVIADEFPIGVFSLGGEKEQLEVVRKINMPLYVFFAIVSIIILALLFYRKYKQSKI
jgi:uncharacterized membrane protein